MLAPMEISIDMIYTFWFIACIGRLSLHAPFFIPNGLCAPTPCTAGERASPRITSEYVQLMGSGAFAKPNERPICNAFLVMLA